MPANKHPRKKNRQAKVLAITSGKGGVGKSSVTINLAITLSQQGANVCIFDADTQLANANILMGLNPKYNIEHLLNGVKTLDEIIISGPAGISIVPASSGMASLSNLNDAQQTRLINALETLEHRFDYLLIDTAAGIGNNVTRFLRAANSILLIISTEPTSLTDAFALLRVLKRSGYKQTTHVLVNMAINYGSGMEVFNRFDGAVKKYLGLSLSYAGYITDDIAVKESVRQQCPVVLYRPDSLAAGCFINLQKVLVNQLPTLNRANKFSTFWKMLLVPKNDNIQATQLTTILSNKSYLADEARQGVLNVIHGSKLDNTDKIAIILALTNDINITVDKKSSSISTENQRRLGKIIAKLQPIYSNNATHNEGQQWKSAITSLSKSGSALEQRLDKLLIELEDILH